MKQLIRSKQGKAAQPAPEIHDRPKAKVIDLMSVLKKSVDEAKKGRQRAA